MSDAPERYACAEADALKIAEWIQTREGIHIWESANLANPGASWTTPVRYATGVLATKPTWEAAEHPARTITDIAEVDVTTAVVVASFHVGTQRGPGLSITVTPAGSRRIRKAVRAAAQQHDKPAWYAFDYAAEKNAIILVEGTRQPLAQWLQAHQPQSEPTHAAST